MIFLELLKGKGRLMVRHTLHGSGGMEGGRVVSRLKKVRVITGKSDKKPKNTYYWKLFNPEKYLSKPNFAKIVGQNNIFSSTKNDHFSKFFENSYNFFSRPLKYTKITISTPKICQSPLAHRCREYPLLDSGSTAFQIFLSYIWCLFSLTCRFLRIKSTYIYKKNILFDTKCSN